VSRTTQTHVPLYLSAEKAAQLRRVAAERGVTQQELLRQGLELALANVSPQANVSCDANVSSSTQPAPQANVSPDVAIAALRAALTDGATVDDIEKRINELEDAGLELAGELDDVRDPRITEITDELADLYQQRADTVAELDLDLQWSRIHEDLRYWKGRRETGDG
jgi:hypothetical protein